jgi:hypothetical protein
MKMAKTIAISDDVHILITKKKTEIFEKYRISVRISDLTNLILRNGVDRSEEFLSLGSVCSPSNTEGHVDTKQK